MMCSENLIPLVYSKPEIWDQCHMHYSSKDIKLKAWTYIGDKLNVSADVAKARWTNLRDLYRRELKKSLRMARQTGDPNAYKPRWKFFKRLMFLKTQILKDDDTVAFDESFYPQTILDDGENTKIGDDYFEDESTQSSTPTHNMATLAEPSSRNAEGNDDSDSMTHEKANKKQRREVRNNSVPSAEDYPDYPSQIYSEMDEDYHFVMSILPSLRRIRQERKTVFKMKVLQLILEEENLFGS